MVSTFFLTKGTDFTGLGTATAADHNNLVNNATPYSEDANTGKGLVIVSTDNITLAPDVPDGITNPILTKGLWVRRPYNTVANQTPKVYAWNDSLASAPTYLKWVEVSLSIDSVNALIAPVNTNANNALATANNALTVANNIQTVANSAATDASAALVEANDANSNVSSALSQASAATAAVASMQTQVTDIKTTADSALATAQGGKSLNTVVSDAILHRGESIEVDLTNDALAYRDKNKDYFLLAETANHGVSMGAPVAGANLRTINTKLQDIGGWVNIIAGNTKFQFVTGGTFRFRIVVPGYGNAGSAHRATLENDTTNAIVLYGTSSYFNGSGKGESIITGVITVIAGDILRVRDYWNATVIPNGKGIAVDINAWTEYYSIVEAWRIK